jgi:hypothetical protein
MENALTVDEVRAFCAVCSWVHEVWSLHRTFQDELPIHETLRHRHGYFLSRLSMVTQQYVLLQICKLHDPPVQGRRYVNLSVDRVVTCGEWNDDTRAELERLRTNLNRLYEDVKPARGKVLAHNDRDTALADVSLGAFPSGKDETYFGDLQRFVDLVHEKSIGGPYPFHEFAKADARLVIEDLLGAAHLRDAVESVLHARASRGAST